MVGMLLRGDRSWDRGVWSAGLTASCWFLYRYLEDDRPDTRDRVAMGFCGLFWPLIAAGFMLWFIFKLPTLGALTWGEREERTRKMQKRIAELERDLGLANGNGKAH